jgi:transcriptional regulator
MTLEAAIAKCDAEFHEVSVRVLAHNEALLRRQGGTDEEVAAELDRTRQELARVRREMIATIERCWSTGSPFAH